MKFGRNVLHVNTHRLTSRIFDLMSRFQNGGHDVISRNKVLKWRPLQDPVYSMDVVRTCGHIAHERADVLKKFVHVPSYSFLWTVQTQKNCTSYLLRDQE